MADFDRDLAVFEQALAGIERLAQAEAERRAQWLAAQTAQAERQDRLSAAREQAAAQVGAAFPGTHASGFGHLGDGNIHFHVRAGDRGGPAWLAEEGEAVSRLVHDLVTAAGGSISAEHGVGIAKSRHLHLCRSAGEIAAMRRVKAALDPRGTLNPGRVLPD